MLREFISEIETMPLHDAAGAESGAVLLAVSGGMDSICMADLFLHSGIDFAIAHCNFRLRGEESQADTDMVQRWAESVGVRLYVKYFDTEDFAQQHGVSIEMAARELRYRWFAALCESEGYCGVAVAHNANDNAETLVLNLVRGAGLKGISGMSKVSPMPYYEGSRTLSVFRPLLRFTRKQIEGYVRSHGIPYRDDSTNAETVYKRNKIRHCVFPIFEQINPSFLKTINREMSYYAQAEDIVEDYCREKLSEMVSECDMTTSLNVSSLIAVKNWERVLYSFLSRFGFNSAVVSSVENLIKSSKTFSGKEFKAGGYVLMTAPGGVLKVRRLVPQVGHAAFSDSLSGILSKTTSQNDVMAAVRTDGRYHFSDETIEVSTVDRASLLTLRQPEGTLILDADKLHDPFVLRKWRNGDWFVPFGMKGRKKLSDFFTDKKIDRFAKENIMVLVPTNNPELPEGRVAAVLGMRIDDYFKITDTTENVLIVKIVKSETV